MMLKARLCNDYRRRKPGYGLRDGGVRGRYAVAISMWTLAALAIPQSARAENARVLNIYNWPDYTSQDLVEKFEKDTGIHVNVHNIDGAAGEERELRRQLKSGHHKYDIIIVGNEEAQRFIDVGLLLPIHAGKIPNFKNIEERWQRRPWDPAAIYSVPWLWGTTSYSVDTAAYKGSLDSLAPLFRPPQGFKGRIGMFNGFDLISLARLYLGQRQCSGVASEMKTLWQLLIEQKPSVKIYTHDGIEDRQASGETIFHQQYSGRTMQTRLRKPSIRYVYAREGAIGWMDNMAVPTFARHVSNAKRFLNFIMDPKNIALQQEYAGYQSAVAGSNAYLPDNMKYAPELNPPRKLKIVFAPSCTGEVQESYKKILTGLGVSYAP